MITSAAMTSAMESALIAWSVLLPIISDQKIESLKCWRKAASKIRIVLKKSGPDSSIREMDRAVRSTAGAPSRALASSSRTRQRVRTAEGTRPPDSSHPL
jgi:hypothetical protein